MNTWDVPEFVRLGFNNKKYINLQREKILERMDSFRGGKLYLEIGGKFPYDPHAARVLPGLDPYAKKEILKNLSNVFEIVFCINAKDIASDRRLESNGDGYKKKVLDKLEDLKKHFGAVSAISVNLCTSELNPEVENYLKKLKVLGYKIYKRYVIDGYPHDTEKVLSETGYGGDDYIETEKNLVIVTGPASNSGKLSTCLGQLYYDNKKGLNSGYAKFETFPIWSLPLSHPVNLAYEAATADIGDYNQLDAYHEKAYGKRAVNYNRDIEAFEIVKKLTSQFLPKDNFMHNYLSPTDMGISWAGFAINNDEVVCIASLNEITRRKDWYAGLRGKDTSEWVSRCQNLENQALKYIKERNYNPELVIRKA